jgi:AraC-like DNA-binding protein
MAKSLDRPAQQGLGRLCADGGGDRIIAAPALDGIERIEGRFSGTAYDPHRHDTYAIGVTLHGVQTFRYRGRSHYSLPGQIIVLHPDEVHDGGAATEAGLRYRMLYLEPSLLAESLDRRSRSLPFVTAGVIDDDRLRAALLAALGPLDEPLDGLFLDDFVARLAEGLIRHSGEPARPSAKPCLRSARLARDYLEANVLRQVDSRELETVTGLDRFRLSRHFRAAYATSPHRFQIMRRLQRARRMIQAGEALAEIAPATGFSDQSHFNRHFRKAFGMTPGRWAALVRG